MSPRTPAPPNPEPLEPPPPTGLRWLLARVKGEVVHWVERRRRALRGVRVHPTAECDNVVFRGPAVVEAHCRLKGNPVFVVGAGVHVGPHVHGQGEIEIGDGSYVGPRTTLWGRDHGIEPGSPIHSQPHRTAPIRIGERVEIGAGAVLLRGVTVGAGARVGAGSVCTRDVAPGSVVVGSPARECDAPGAEGETG